MITTFYLIVIMLNQFNRNTNSEKVIEASFEQIALTIIKLRIGIRQINKKWLKSDLLILIKFW